MAKIHANNPVVRNPPFATQVFDAARRPVAWLVVSRRLRQSADAIFDRENPIARRFYNELRRDPAKFDREKFPWPNFDAAYMLIAFAIENLLKGLLVAKGVVTFTAQKIPAALKGHDLRTLHGRAKTAATINPAILESLTYMSEWRARYPFPTEIERFWPMRDDGTFKTGGGFIFPQSHHEFLAYCEALDAELRGYLSASDLQFLDRRR